jgi:hypothetical protein
MMPGGKLQNLKALMQCFCISLGDIQRASKNAISKTSLYFILKETRAATPMQMQVIARSVVSILNSRIDSAYLFGGGE